MDHKAAIEWETQLLSELLNSEDARKIMRRFLER
jgi:hypothetical protein